MMSNEPDANIYHIMQLLGHTQIKTAQKYIDNQIQERSKKNKELMGRLSAKGGFCDLEKGVAPKVAPEGKSGGMGKRENSLKFLSTGLTFRVKRSKIQIKVLRAPWINGIQEVSGSLPLISTRKEKSLDTSTFRAFLLQIPI